MGRPGLHRIRRQQLIDATISAISIYGLADTTVSRISSAAGVSPGIVHHYFTGKDELLEVAMRSLLSGLQRSILSQLRNAKDPYERIVAVVEGNFSPDQFKKEVVRAWLAFWSHAPQTAEISRLQRINAARTRSNLLHSLKQLLPVESAAVATANLTALMDGLWLRCALESGTFPPEEGRRLALAYVDSQVRKPKRKAPNKGRRTVARSSR